jgi:putative ABC transport system permease protein
MGLNQLMVVLQFGVSVVLIITTLVVHSQLTFVRTKELGFEKEHIVILPFFLQDRGLRPQVGAILNELHAQPGVLKASAFHTPPGRIAVDRRILRAEGHGDAIFKLYWNGIDDSYLDLFRLSIVSGRSLIGMPAFSRIDENKWEAFALINETAARELGWDNPVGKSFFSTTGRIQTRVIGVVKDYHNQSLHHGIAPMILQNSTSLNWVAVRLSPGDLRIQLAALESVWKQFLSTRQLLTISHGQPGRFES